MHLVIGLGPIGGNIGAHLAQLGQEVYGYDFNAERVREWSDETQSPAGSDLAALDWPSIDSVHVAVRLADQVKLLNNALATYNLAATARMLTLAEHLGTPAKGLFDVIAVSTGQSWMSDNLVDVQYDLLLKDVGLLRGEIGALPAGGLDDDVEQAILQARALLGID